MHIRKMISFLMLLVLVASFVSAQDITEVPRVQKPVSSAVTPQKDSATAVEYALNRPVLKFLDLTLGNQATLRLNQPLRGQKSQLSVVSISGDTATLRFSSTLTVELGQIVDLGGQKYQINAQGDGIILIIATASQPSVSQSSGVQARVSAGQQGLLGTTPTARPQTGLLSRIMSVFK